MSVLLHPGAAMARWNASVPRYRNKYNCNHRTPRVYIVGMALRVFECSVQMMRHEWPALRLVLTGFLRPSGHSVIWRRLLAEKL